MKNMKVLSLRSCCVISVPFLSVCVVFFYTLPFLDSFQLKTVVPRLLSLQLQLSPPLPPAAIVAVVVVLHLSQSLSQI